MPSGPNERGPSDCSVGPLAVVASGGAAAGAYAVNATNARTAESLIKLVRIITSPSSIHWRSGKRAIGPPIAPRAQYARAGTLRHNDGLSRQEPTLMPLIDPGKKAP